MEGSVANEETASVQSKPQSWAEKLKPANPIGFVISSVISIAAVLVFFFAIPCPDQD